MKPTYRILIGATCVAAAFLAAALPASAATSAKVSEVVQDVSISGRQANLGDTLAGNNSLKTGTRSRAELTFEDTTLLRVGSNSVFSFLGTRGRSKDFSLTQGTAFVSAPDKHGGVNVRCGGVTAAIEGCLVTVSDTSNGVFVGSSEVTGEGIKILNESGKAIFNFETNTFWYAPRNADGSLDLGRAISHKYDSFAQLQSGWTTEGLPEEILEIAKRAKIRDYQSNQTNDSPGTEKDPTDVSKIEERKIGRPERDEPPVCDDHYGKKKKKWGWGKGSKGSKGGWGKGSKGGWGKKKGRKDDNGDIPSGDGDSGKGKDGKKKGGMFAGLFGGKKDGDGPEGDDGPKGKGKGGKGYSKPPPECKDHRPPPPDCENIILITDIPDGGPGGIYMNDKTHVHHANGNLCPTDNPSALAER